MKVGIYLIQDISPSAGGNFSYYNKLVTAIDGYQFDERVEICYVGRLPEKNIGLHKPYVKLSGAGWYRLFRFLKRIKITRFLSAVFSFNADLCNRNDLDQLRKNEVDILLLPKPFFLEVDNFPFITINWDAGHRSTFMFPEFVRSFDVREKWYTVEMQKALAVIVESEAGKQEFERYFGFCNGKIQIVPLFPGVVADLVVALDKQGDALKKFGLVKHQYFFYPAQYWAHKNHYNLILAFKKLMESLQTDNLKLVFTGSDKGNKQYIFDIVKELGVEKSVVDFGFVSNEDVYTLYKNAIALVMPTFLGPTNMPLLEAQALQTAVICSDLVGHHEICGDGALYADPTDPDQWFHAMKSLLIEEERNQLISRADKVKEKSVFNIHHAIKKLDEILVKMTSIRKTFR